MSLLSSALARRIGIISNVLLCIFVVYCCCCCWRCFFCWTTLQGGTPRSSLFYTAALATRFIGQQYHLSIVTVSTINSSYRIRHRNATLQIPNCRLRYFTTLYLPSFLSRLVVEIYYISVCLCVSALAPR